MSEAVKVHGFPDRGVVWVWCCAAEAEHLCPCSCHHKARA